MAPSVPEEVDVFTVPHSRMKELVTDYFQRLEKTNFCNDLDLQGLLESLQHTFVEFKHHERIENTLIMKKLKVKLKELSVRNQAVCNCHKDSHLTDMLQLVSDGYHKKTAQDRINYGLQLRAALEEFTEDFLPHMKQEEEVFQPLLLKYFSYEELCELKNKVIDRHFHKKTTETIEKFLLDDTEREASDSDDEELCRDSETSINDLPAELTSKIFSNLDPQDLARCAQVCLDWSELAYDPLLWKHIHPVKWAQGNWSYKFDPEEATNDDDDADSSGGEEGNYTLIDEDADIDESAESDDDIADIQLLRREAHILVDIAKYVLPRVGTAVQTLDLGRSRAITSALLNKLLRQCPNIEVLNLTNTRISDTGLKSLGRNSVGSNLKWLDLGGCTNVTDATLMRLALALSQDDMPAAEQMACKNQCAVSVTQQSCLCEEVRNMEETLAQLKVKNLQSSWSADSSAYVERHVKIHLDKNALDYVHAKNVDKNGQVDCEINGMCCTNETPEHATCHAGCSTDGAVDNAIEECAGQKGNVKMTATGCKNNHLRNCDKNTLSWTDWKRRSPLRFDRTLRYLNLSGCYQITDVGLRALRGAGPLSRLEQLELSGCPWITGAALTSFVDACPALPGTQLAYCDNIQDGPYADCANGCQNICSSRYCCRSGK